MMRSLRLTTLLVAACLFALPALPAAAQQPAPALENHPLARLSTRMAGQAQAVFAPKKYRLEILQDENPPTYQTFTETTRIYDAGRVSEEVTQTLDFMSGSMTLQNSSRTTYDYANSRVTTWAWESSAWAPRSRDTYTYNSSGLLTSQVTQKYESGAWVNDYRTTNTYNRGALVQSVDDVWNGTAWVPETRSLFAEQNGGVLGTDQNWDGSAWVNDTRTFVPNMTLAQVTALEEEFNTIQAFGVFLYIPTRRLAELSFAMESSEETWNGSAWVNSSRMRVITNTPSTISSVDERWNGSAWVADGRTTLTFDGTRTTSMIMEDFEDDDWVPASKTIYSYDASGNVTLIENFADDDEDGEFDDIAGSRFVVEWTDITTSVEGGEHVRVASLTSVQPSPATDAAEVHFALAQPGPVMLRLFDVLGREVSTLAAGVHAAGAHAAQLDAASLPAGLYFVRLEAGGVSETRSLVVAR